MNCNEIAKQYTRQEFVEQLEKRNYQSIHINKYVAYCPSSINLKNINGNKKNDKCDYDNCKKCWMNAIKDVKFKDEIQEDKKVKLFKINNIKINEELWTKLLLGKCVLVCNYEDYMKTITYLFNKKIRNYFQEFKKPNPLDKGKTEIFTICISNAEHNEIYYHQLFIKDEVLIENKKYSASEILHMIETGNLNDNDMIITNEGVFHTIKVAKNSMISSLITLAPYKIKKYEEPKYITFDEAVKSGKRFKYKNCSEYMNLETVLWDLHENWKDSARNMLSKKVWLIEE